MIAFQFVTCLLNQKETEMPLNVGYHVKDGKFSFFIKNWVYICYPE